jgi:pimeloyl-ACP methyl ester carboxylesterase
VGGSPDATLHVPLQPVPHTLAGVPVLVVRPTLAPAAGVPPLVLWLPGFRADAAANAAELVELASAGFVAVGVDAVGHGRRRAVDLDARIARAPGGARGVMLELAAATAGELPALLAAAGAEGLGDPACVGIVGVSMGGYLAYRAAQTLPGVRAVVAVLGSPEWGAPGAAGADSPHRRPAAFGRVALLSITAERDTSVPPGAARQLHAALAAAASADGAATGAGGALAAARYLELPGAEHLMGSDDWARAMAEARGWLREHLRPRRDR